MVAEIAGVYAHPPLFVLHSTLFSEIICGWKDRNINRLSVSHLGFLYLYGRSPRPEFKKKKKRSNICLLFWGCGACDVWRFFLLLVCCNWQHCNSLSLACNPVIYLWHTILSDLHCVQYVTLTPHIYSTSRIILAAICSKVLTWGSVCKQGCCICFISPVLKWRDDETHKPWLYFSRHVSHVLSRSSASSICLFLYGSCAGPDIDTPVQN